MGSDPNKKSVRTFQCRDVLWETFEHMARELECSVDFLVNEAMKQYARQQRYPQASPLPPTNWVRSTPPPLPPPPPRVPTPPSPMRAAAPSTPPPLPPPPSRGTLGSPVPSLGGGLGQAIRNVPPPPRSTPPPLPRSASPVPPSSHLQNGTTPRATLSLFYQGEKITVTKDRFVIGRGKQSSDLILKDPNVSRQHAMIEYQNGLYFMVDMGSTNGVEYNGQRIARKQIAEGDVFVICDHGLTFTYR